MPAPYIQISRTPQRFSGSAHAFPELFAIIGSQVPDYRGLFLRGYGSQVSNHYGTVTHSSAELGRIQGDAIRNIAGELYGVNNSVEDFLADTTVYSVGALYVSRITTTRGGIQNTNNRGDYPYGFAFNASRVVPTAQENRPVNRAVRYLIRALP